MNLSTRLLLALKAARQLGLAPLALYGLYKFGLVTGHYKRAASRPLAVGDQQLKSILPLPSRKSLLAVLGKDGQRALFAEADEIAAGKVRLFGGEPVDLKLTFGQPLAHWTDYETGKVPIPYSQFPIPDIKFIWEPARFGWAFVLGRAYHISGKEKYAESFWRFTEQFLDANPPCFGPHWMNGQEVAIRLMALVWAAQVFAASKHSTPERKARLTESIVAHASRIPPTLLYARAQNNNHLFVEAAALFTAGRVLPDHPESETWRALGWKWLNWAIRHQIGSYGEYIQHSTNYHRLMLQTVLWVTAILNQCREAWPALTSEPLARAAHWLFSMLDPASGRTPNLGANDGAYIFPLSIGSFADFRPVVQAAARAFLRSQMKAGAWDETSLWLGLPSIEKTHESDAYLTDNLRGRTSWAYLRASRFKSRLLHMDQLHFDLWWRGLNVAQDAGTYLYNAAPPWDNPLAATRVHNTVTVDGRDQMTGGGRFLTLDWFPAYSKSLLELDESILHRVLAYHKGYRRLGVRHERTTTVYADERWEVKDELLLSRPGHVHMFRLHWLLPDWKWEVENWGSGIEIRLKSPHGWIALRIRPDPQMPNVEPRISLIRAGELVHGQGGALPFEGWVSLTYGHKIPALSLALEVTASQSTAFLSEFIFPK